MLEKAPARSWDNIGCSTTPTLCTSRKRLWLNDSTPRNAVSIVPSASVFYKSIRICLLSFKQTRTKKSLFHLRLPSSACIALYCVPTSVPYPAMSVSFPLFLLCSFLFSRLPSFTPLPSITLFVISFYCSPFPSLPRTARPFVWCVYRRFDIIDRTIRKRTI